MFPKFYLMFWAEHRIFSFSTNWFLLYKTYSISFLKLSTCADLANLVNVAAIKAAVEGADKLNSEQLEFAKDRIMMGTERKTMFVTEESKKVSNLFSWI